MVQLSDGKVNVGDPVAVVAGDIIGVLESVTSFAKGVSSGVTRYNFRRDSDASLTGYAGTALRLLTTQELSDRNDAIALAAAQAANDTAAAALVALGGDPCP